MTTKERKTRHLVALFYRIKHYFPFRPVYISKKQAFADIKEARDIAPLAIYKVIKVCIYKKKEK